jgi:hypothetical protein
VRRAWIRSPKLPLAVGVVVGVSLLAAGGTHMASSGGMSMGTVRYGCAPSYVLVAGCAPFS